MSSLRDTFPRGLVQPEGAFRSSVDALLLADCALTALSTASLAARQSPLVVDLGTGSGMAACAVGLRAPQVRGVGVDKEGALIEAARRNVASLELDHLWRMETADAGDLALLRQMCGLGQAQVVLANPPYRKEGTGRVSAQALRRTALHGQADTLHVFCGAARALLRHHGSFCLVFVPSRLAELLDALRAQDLGVRSVRCVHTRPHKAAELLLVTARKNAAEDISILPPLYVYAADEGETLTDEARRILFEE